MSQAPAPAAPARLLADTDPEPVVVMRRDGASPMLLVCDHAGRSFPAALGQLGLANEELDRHIAWDIGARAVARLLSQALDAALVEQVYSRLVIDCNRPLEAEGSVPRISETTEIPGNLDLSEADRTARQEEIFAPYHAAIRGEIARRDEARRRSVLVAIHSFTPVYKGESRPWHVGTLYGRDARLAAPLGAVLSEEDGLVVGDNQPYDVTDATDWTIPTHGEALKLLHVGIEIRQDLVADEAGQKEWAERLAAALPKALAAADRAPA